ncbi:MAG: hypothetical protein ACXV8Q_03505 [Methylobacter sp.]
MSIDIEMLGLSIEHPSVTPKADNFRPPTWPPSPDFPVVLDAQGKVISRYGDPFWDVSLWAAKPMRLSFEAHSKGKATQLTTTNNDLLRQITAWWLFGDGRVYSIRTLTGWFSKLHPLFAHCSQLGIAASNLSRFPAVIDEYAKDISPTDNARLTLLLNRLYEQRSELGFEILDRSGIARLHAASSDENIKQTPYIPPRIWTYQVTRLREFLDDFNAHQDQFDACFRFCLDTYTQKSGGLLNNVFENVATRRSQYKPFSRQKSGNAGVKPSSEFQGPFILTAERFGIKDFLERWCIRPNASFEDYGIRVLAYCFSMVSYVGTAYILNFSLMRIEEAWNLRSDCLMVEHDEQFGDIYILCGETTKTLSDANARWPTSPSVKVAIDAMTFVARLRMICAQANPKVSLSAIDLSNPYLVQRAYEPWVPTKENKSSVRPRVKIYRDSIEYFPNLLDPKQLQITESDIQIARLVNPDLDDKKFAEGKPWRFRWHQFRRTGAVNMQASGLVSDASLQYLLKHLSRTCSLYYGRNFSRLSLDNQAQQLYVKTIYEILGKEFANLLTDRFVSPHGERRKSEILKLVTPQDDKKLTQLAKSGKLMYRPILLGGCAKRDGPCQYGGIESVAHCGGGDSSPPCADVLYDREKASLVRRLDQTIDERLVKAPEGSPDRDALLDQKRSVRNYFDAISACTASQEIG